MCAFIQARAALVRFPAPPPTFARAAYLPDAAEACPSGRHALYFFHRSCRGLAHAPFGW
jgi:hypothetical protein